MEIHPGKGVLTEEVSKHQETLALAGLGEVFEYRRATLLGGEKNPTDYMPKINSQQKSTQMPASATSKWGRNGEGQSALLKVRIGHECPEGNRREPL